MKSRNWCFTINNPTCDDELNLRMNDQITFLCAALEIGKSGTLHYQGYLELKSPRALTYLKNQWRTGHWEIRRGKKIEAIKYTIKTFNIPAMSNELCSTVSDIIYNLNGETDGQPFSLSLSPWICREFDGTFDDLIKLGQTPKKKSLKERLTEIQVMIQNNATDQTISNEYFMEWCRYRGAFKEYRLLNTQQRDFKTFVTVIQGPTGTGKSKYCNDNYPNAYWKGRDQWWCGYNGQETTIIDEYYGWLPYDFILRLCDRYPIDVEVKGGKITFTSKNIIFTTNKLPEKWYTNVYFPAFVRRVDEWIVMDGFITSKYKKYEDVKFKEI